MDDSRNTSAKRRRLLLITVVGAPLLAAATALAGPVHGNLRLPGPAAAEEGPRDHYWQVRNGHRDPRPARLDPERDVSVVLTGASGPSESGCYYAIRGGDLSPRNLVARVGAQFQLQNTDPTQHTIFAEGLEAFGSSTIGAGRQREVRIDEAGSWPLGDQLYAHVHGTLITLPDLVACARVNRRGSYTFSDIPPGDYTIKVFFEGREAHSAALSVANQRDVTVPAITVSRN